MPRHFHRERTPAKITAAGPRPVLEMTQLPIFRVHYRRLEEYLAKVYRMEGFDFLFASGAVPALVPEYAVSPTLPPAEDARRQADAIRDGRRSRDVALILNVLCQDGYIPAGKYIIDTRPEPSPIDQYRALLRKTGNPLSAECVAFRDAHRQDRVFTRIAAEIDTAVLKALRDQQE
jgi:hypothetical protein